MVDFFADTYALVGHYKDAPAYRKHFEAREFATTALNLVEFAYTVTRAGQGDRVPELLAPLHASVVEPGREVVEAAARFKHERLSAGARCSYVDAWGYATARSLDVPFLTGDEDFRGVPGVKFVKA